MAEAFAHTDDIEAFSPGSQPSGKMNPTALGATGAVSDTYFRFTLAAGLCLSLGVEQFDRIA
jgi:hypothetical protein